MFGTTTPDPTGGAGDTFWHTIQPYLTDHVVVAVLALVVINIIVFGFVLPWAEKSGHVL
jgi:hypothetical protein